MKKKNTTPLKQFQNLIDKSKEAKLIPLTHIYMTTHFPGMVHLHLSHLIRV